MNWTPIRKVVIGAVASGVAIVAHRLGVDLGSATVNEIAVVAVGTGAAWAVKDPRVIAAERAVESVVARVERDITPVKATITKLEVRGNEANQQMAPRVAAPPFVADPPQTDAKA